ncbi:MAG: LysM peptidoglycan-binding domain-containing protein [Clostridia bacterium]|nr:LysM peptidoglycan-binding domain-containing protein [Clostridia bacterium]
MNEELKNVQTINDGEMSEAAGGAGRARWITYTIQRGDTLIKIANRFGVSVANLCQWNAIADPDFIVAGHRLSIYTSR